MAVQTEAEIPAPLHPFRSMAGGDFGMARFLALSDGTVYRPLNFFAKLARRLAREERRLSRKVKGSRNWLRQKAGITGLHIRIADASSDYLHKVSSAVSKNHAVVVLEELRVGNMSASARGTLLAPGCRVRQKGGLNRAILGVGRVRPPAGIQRVLAGRAGALRRCCVHQPKVLALRAVRPGEPDGTGELRVSFLTAWRPMPTTTRRSTFWRRGTPSSPVESTAQQGRLTKQEPQEPLRRKPQRPLESLSFRTARMSIDLLNVV